MSCTYDEHDAHHCAVASTGARSAPGDARSGCARTGARGTPLRYSDSREHPARVRRLGVLHQHRRHALGGERRQPAADAAAGWYSNVPAPLRYAIARGLEAVEAPPFASLDEFSRVLERFEKGASRDVLRAVLQRGARLSRPIGAPLAVAPTPVRRPAAGPSPMEPRPAVVPSVPTLVVRKPVGSSSEPPLAAVAPMFTSFGADGEPSSPVHSWRRSVMPAAAALVASFVVGFALGDRITDRRAATKPSSARVSPGISAAAPAANDSAANPATVELRDEIVRVPRTPAVARGIGPPRAAPEPMLPQTRRAGPVNTSVSRSGPSRPSARPMRTPSLRPSRRTARRSSSTPAASATAAARSKSPPPAARQVATWAS